jgi:hypothetical protein
MMHPFAGNKDILDFWLYRLPFELRITWKYFSLGKHHYTTIGREDAHMSYYW